MIFSLKEWEEEEVGEPILMRHVLLTLLLLLLLPLGGMVEVAETAEVALVGVI